MFAPYGELMLNDEELASRLALWLAPQLGTSSVEVSGLARSGAGNSNDTVVFTAVWDGQPHKLVVRIQPGSDSLYKYPSAAREARVIQAVEAVGTVPVPHVIGIEEDASVLGAPFFVMDHVEGRVLKDVPSYHKRGWLVDLTPEERAKHWDECLRVTVEVSKIHGLPELKSGKRPINALTEITRETLDWAAQGRDTGLLELGMQWLEANVPDRDDDSLSWGDARPGNVLFNLDGTVAAVLDWEAATLGPAELDLGWWLFMEDVYGRRTGLTPLEGVPIEEPLIARWEEFIGRPAQNLQWCRMQAAIQMGLVMLRHRDQQVTKGLLTEDATTHLYNPVTQILAEYLGEPVPELSPHFAELMRAMSQQKSAKDAAKETSA